jgi:RNA polymerase sigma-70 factor (subfamily 1)
MPALTEHELIERAQLGDRLALGQAFLQHQARLLRRMAARMPPSLGRLISPEDIVQQCYKRAFGDFGTFEYRGNGSFYTWLQTIADHQLLNTVKAFKTQKRGGQARLISAFTNGGSVHDLVDALADDVETPSFCLRQAETAQALHVALAELPHDYQEVVCRRYLRGEEIGEIATAMDRTPASVRAMILRAKSRLRKTLAKLSLFLSRGK